MTRKLTAWHCGVAELRQEFSVVTASHISVTPRPWASRSRRIVSVPRRILGQPKGDRVIHGHMRQGRSQGGILRVLGPPNPIPLKIIKDKTCRPYTHALRIRLIEL